MPEPLDVMAEHAHAGTAYIICPSCAECFCPEQDDERTGNIVFRTFGLEVSVFRVYAECRCGATTSSMEQYEVVR